MADREVNHELPRLPAVAPEEEAYRFLTDVMRGTVAEPGGREVSVGDRLKACSGLMKLYESGLQAAAGAGERERALARASERIGRLIGPAFAGVLGDVLVHGHTHYDLAGGRGSMKSSFVSLSVVYLLLLEPDAHALVLRKVANTMRDSVYAQYLWAVEKLGLTDCFECRTSPMELELKPTGQKILFRGADDPLKLKSVKVPFGAIRITHFEEKDQFAGREEIRAVLQSTMRGAGSFWNFESYNPPRSRDNWANLDSASDRPDRLCHRSTYLDAPRAWLGEQFILEAENLKRDDERAYRHEYLGEAVGSGGSTLTDGANTGAFIDASVSSDGYTAYLSAESGCKAMATVLNPKQEPIYRFSSRTRYLNACAVSEKGAYLAAASLEEQNSIYRSGVTILRTDEALADLESDESSAVRVDLGNQVVYELRFLDRTHLMAAAQDEIVFLNIDGERLAELALEPGELIDYSVSEEGWLILALNRSGGSRVLSLNAEGEKLGEQELPDRVRSVSATGSYAAVLTDMYLQTYDRKLTAYEHSVEIQAATRVIVRADGTALLIGSSGTKLFIP